MYTDRRDYSSFCFTDPRIFFTDPRINFTDPRINFTDPRREEYFLYIIYLLHNKILHHFDHQFFDTY